MWILSLLLSQPTLGCSLISPAVFDVDPTLTGDEIAPDMPEFNDLTIHRGRGPRKLDDGSMMSTSCDDIGFITIELMDPAEDDPEDVGYSVDLLDGELPMGLTLPEGTYAGPGISLSWIDEAIHDQDPFGFTLQITPFDTSGNQGDPLEVWLEDDGIPDAESAPYSCSVVRDAPVGLIWVLVGLLAARRRQ